MPANLARYRLLSAILMIGIPIVLLLVGMMASSQAASGAKIVEASSIDHLADRTEQEPIATSTEPWIESVPGRIIVKVKPGFNLPNEQSRGANSASSLAGLMRDLGVSAIQSVFVSAQTGQTRGRGTTVGLDRIYRLDYDGSIPLEHAVALLGADPNVEYAEPDYVARAARVPNDAEYSQQWALAKINAPAAWDVSTGSSAVVIAVIDSGLDLDHPEFAGRLWVNPSEQAGTGVDNDLNGYIDDINGWNVFANNTALDDDNGHGTQVAGVIGAASDNSVGVAGMCWTCQLMIVKASQATGIANYSDIAAGVAYAASNGAHVINLSLGGYADSAMLRDAIREAATTAVIVAGAGNDDTSNPFYPAAYPEVMAVAATDQNDHKAVFSDYGAWVDVTAPGTSIRTTQVGGYATANGTSLSAPFVAGLAGLIRSAHPNWSPELVKWQILNTAAGIENLNPTFVKQLGYGRIDAGSALATVPQARAAVESYSIDGQPNGRPAPGQTFQLMLTLRNLWMPAQNLQATLTSTDPYVTISDAVSAFGSIDSGKLGSNSAEPFGITIAINTPYNHPLALTLLLTGDNGYTHSLPFTLPVRSAVETLGNTMYVEDTLWTSDKTYILNGTIIVGTGVSLTIQPGTLIKGNPGKFIRVDGTLIAQGTAEQPILFTTNSADKTAWAGIRFADSAVDATYDSGGHYQSGSVIQHAELSYSESGIRLSSRAPYIADSMFQNNVEVIRVGTNGNGGSPRIERNHFGIVRDPIAPGAEAAIVLDGGQPLIQDNSFVETGASGVAGRGSPKILNNVFQGNTNAAINLDCCGNNGNTPVIHGNTIINNGGGISASGLQVVDIEGNLIAGNTGLGLALDVQNSNSAGYTWPSLAYNSAQDEYLATWAYYDGVIGQAALQSLGGDAKPLADSRTWGCGEAATAIYNPDRNEYLLSTRYGGAWDDRICAQRVNADGNFTGTTIIIAANQMFFEGQAAYDQSDQQYLFFWQNMNNGPFGIDAQWLSADTLPVGMPVHIGDDVLQQYGSNLILGDVAYDPMNDQTLAVFQSETARHLLWGAWLDGPGIAPSNSFTLTNDSIGPPLNNPSIAYGNGRYLVVWDRTNSGNTDRSIVGQILAADGTILVDQTVIHTAMYMGNAQIAYDTTSTQFMVVWVQSSDGGSTHEVMSQRIGSNGILIGQPITIRSGADLGYTFVSSPAIVYNSVRDEYLVAWVDNRQANQLIYAQRISADGQLLDNAWTLDDESQSSVNFLLTKPRGGVRLNTIIDNTGNGIAVRGNGASALTIANNNLFGNGDYEIYVEHGSPGSQNYTLEAVNNFWNLPSGQITGRIRDCTFDENACNTASSTLPKVNYTPVLAEPEPDAPAFVRSTTMTPNPVGQQRGVVTVDFSRPMITTTLPTATFYDARRGTTEKMLDHSVQAMAQDVIGRLWFAGDWENPGVNMFDGQTWNIVQGITGTITAIYGASSGDVWFAHAETPEFDQPTLSRLQGTTWVTYSQELPSIGWVAGTQTIGEDGAGNLWFGTMNSILRFDGMNWQRYTTDDGLAGNMVYQVERDGQGRMWFRTDQGLSVFDGVNWQTYKKGNGLPTNQTNALFVDSQGRVWIGLGWYESDSRSYVGTYDGSAWVFYGSQESGGRLNCDINGFGEDINGRIWMYSCNHAVILDGQSWSELYFQPELGDRFIFDSQGHLWYPSNGWLNVRWAGLDYIFTEEQWLSSTRFQAGYDFDARVPQGEYRVKLADAVGSDDILAYGTGVNSFSVQFAGSVSTLLPLPPSIRAETDGTLSNLSAVWQTQDTDIELFRYAIGTFPGGRDVVGWTYLAGTSMARNDLQLQSGRSYYVTVQARNSNGLWSADGVSRSVIGGTVTNPTATSTPPTTPSDTPTPTHAVTNTPTPTATSTSTAMPSNTPTPTHITTNTPTPTSISTHTPTPTRTPTIIPATTGTPTPTNTTTNTPTATPTATATPTVAAGTIFGAVFEDGNNNGTQESGEPGVEGANVTLRANQLRNGLTDRETVTDSQGHYTFADVATGSYQIGVQLPQAYGVGDILWQDVTVAEGNAGVPVPSVAAPRIHWLLYLPSLKR